MSERDIGWATIRLSEGPAVERHGFVSEQSIAGVAFLRIDIPEIPPLTEFYRGDVVSSIAPTSEGAVREKIASWRRVCESLDQMMLASSEQRASERPAAPTLRVVEDEERGE